jgi:cytochrome c biogenesis protein CcmG/thiol:disulfide interchange protein DsbE
VPAGRTLAQIVALAAVAVLLLVLIWRLTHEPPRATAGEPAPTFALQRLDRNAILDLSRLRGHPVVLNFWASWCRPCKAEAATLERTWRQYRKQGLVLVGVDVNDADSDARRFMQAHGITYPVVRDPNGSIAANSYNVADLPMTFFIDRRGRLAATQIRGDVGDSARAKEFRTGLQAVLGS